MPRDSLDHAGTEFNGHTHAAMTCFPGDRRRYGPDGLAEQLHLFPAEAKS